MTTAGGGAPDGHGERGGDPTAGDGAAGGPVPLRVAVGWMLREEWRLHARLFGGRRFALFPVVLAVLAGGTAAFFALGAADEGLVIAGLHAVVGLVGLQVGTVGLVGRDALENLLGETTLLVYAARILPVSPRRLVVAFVVKDVAYYAVLFVAPLVVGAVPLAVAGALPYARLPALFVTVLLSFALGVGLSLALVGLATRRRAAAVGLVAAVGAVGLAAPGPTLAATPYGLWAAPSPLGVAASLLAPVALGALGAAAVDLDRSTPARRARDRFRALHRRLGSTDRQGVLAKSLLDVARSSGGLWKVALSQGLVFAVVAVLLAYVPRVVPVRPSPGLTLAAVLALGSFTTYNWLCQVDDERFYLTYPIGLAAVFRAKLFAFLLLAVPTGLLYLALGVVVFDPGTVAVGVVAFVPLSVYVFGVTAFVAGLRPTELLFDTPVFAGFTLAMMAVLLPLVIAAIAYPLDPALYGGGAVVLSVVAGLTGLAAYRRAGPRWTRKARAE